MFKVFIVFCAFQLVISAPFYGFPEDPRVIIERFKNHHQEGAPGPVVDNECLLRTLSEQSKIIIAMHQDLSSAINLMVFVDKYALDSCTSGGSIEENFALHVLKF